MVLWLESSIDHVDPDLIKRFREEPKYLHIEVLSDTPRNEATGPDQIERTIDLAVLCTVWIKSFQSSFLESIAGRLLGFTDCKFCSPLIRITGCYCPHTTSLASHSSLCHFDQRAYHAACLRTAKMVISELLLLGGGFKGAPLRKLEHKIRYLLDSTPARGYPFDPWLFPVYKTLFEFLGSDGMQRRASTRLDECGKGWLKWLKTCPDGFATSAHALEGQIRGLYFLSSLFDLDKIDSSLLDMGIPLKHEPEPQKRTKRWKYINRGWKRQWKHANSSQEIDLDCFTKEDWEEVLQGGGWDHWDWD
ncbi:hypothetical protein V5O48_016783 [Marasmius crinis-equi]|uniref:Uncharacterized protein n=1 Tax=Marasmius crinis-equi TaxID=585013 RepID=A0ABR3ER11_9AGAR